MDGKRVRDRGSVLLRQATLIRAATLTVAALFVGLTQTSAQLAPGGNQKHFSGPYFSTNVGSQNLFGGAFINNIDVLTQDRRRVVEVSAGVRGQLLGDQLLIGAEVQYGLTDGDLMHFDAPSQSDVSYQNNSQRGFGLTLGYVGGPKANFAIFSYAFATDRSFEISIQDANGSYRQTDGQSFLQYGLGVEARVSGSWHVDASVGRQYFEFGDLVTNVELEQKLDLTVGVTYQF